MFVLYGLKQGKHAHPNTFRLKKFGLWENNTSVEDLPFKTCVGNPFINRVAVKNASHKNLRGKVA